MDSLVVNVGNKFVTTNELGLGGAYVQSLPPNTACGALHYSEGFERYYRLLRTAHENGKEMTVFDILGRGLGNRYRWWTHKFACDEDEILATDDSAFPIIWSDFSGTRASSLTSGVFFDGFGRGVAKFTGSSPMQATINSIGVTYDGGVTWSSDYRRDLGNGTFQLQTFPGTIDHVGLINDRFVAATRLGVYFTSSPVTQPGELTWTLTISLNHAPFSSRGIQKSGNYYMASAYHSKNLVGPWVYIPTTSTGYPVLYGNKPGCMYTDDFFEDKALFFRRAPETEPLEGATSIDILGPVEFVCDLPTSVAWGSYPSIIWDGTFGVLFNRITKEWMFTTNNGGSWWTPSAKYRYFQYHKFVNGKMRIIASPNVSIYGEAYISDVNNNGFTRLNIPTQDFLVDETEIPAPNMVLTLGSLDNVYMPRISWKEYVEFSIDGKSWQRTYVREVRSLRYTSSYQIDSNGERVVIISISIGVTASSARMGWLECVNGSSFYNRGKDLFKEWDVAPLGVSDRADPVVIFTGPLMGQMYLAVRRSPGPLGHIRGFMLDGPSIVAVTEPSNTLNKLVHEAYVAAHAAGPVFKNYASNRLARIVGGVLHETDNFINLYSRSINTPTNSRLSKPAATEDFQLGVIQLDGSTSDATLLSEDNFATHLVGDQAYSDANSFATTTWRGGVIMNNRSSASTNLFVTQDGYTWFQINYGVFGPGPIHHVATNIPPTGGEGWKIGAI